MPRRRRLDAELVEQGFFSSVDEALRAVMAGDVSTSDRRLTSPGEQVAPGIPLHVRGRAAYVSRGGLKLERGLAAFGVDPEGLACLDVGCSTGGFTDCLLRLRCLVKILLIINFLRKMKAWRFQKAESDARKTYV